MPRVGRQCRIGQVDEDHLTWTDRTVADHLRTSIADDHLLFVCHDFDALAEALTS